jgi:hypothetical protein
MATNSDRIANFEKIRPDHIKKKKEKGAIEIPLPSSKHAEQE